MSKQVRLGIIGIGAMGSTHAQAALKGEIRRCRLTAVCDVNASKMEPYAGLAHFERSEDLIRSGLVDAVLVATPHYFHTTIGIAALKNGLHLLTEKPLSVHKNDALKLIAAHTDKKLVFALMFMFRTESPWLKLKQLITSGELGRINRILWINTDWFRPDAYFATGAWRGSWKGEGGGVLLNQCPHHLDIWQWLFGMPSSVRGFCGLGKRHAIDVEDEVTAYMEYADGCTGVFITGTGEAPGSNRVEIAAERGKVVLEGRRIHFSRNESESTAFMRTSPDAYAGPAVWEAEIPVRFTGGSHNEVTQNFVDAILDGSPLVAPAEEGLRALELGNAILYSSLIQQTVQLPLDGDAFEARLNALIANPREVHP